MVGKHSNPPAICLSANRSAHLYRNQTSLDAHTLCDNDNQRHAHNTIYIYILFPRPSFASVRSSHRKTDNIPPPSGKIIHRVYIYLAFCGATALTSARNPRTFHNNGQTQFTRLVRCQRVIEHEPQS